MSNKFSLYWTWISHVPSCASAGFIFFILPHSSAMEESHFTKVEETHISHPHAVALAIMVNSTEITPVCQYLSCAKSQDPALFGWSHWCSTLEQHLCLTLLLWLCKWIPRLRGCFAVQVYFFLARDCCFPGICCLSVSFLQSCFCSVSPNLSCCRGEYFPGFCGTP